MRSLQGKMENLVIDDTVSGELKAPHGSVGLARRPYPLKTTNLDILDAQTRQIQRARLLMTESPLVS
jgi:hypothetical protein